MRQFALIALSYIFLASGGAKLLQLPFEVTAFERWGYPHALMLIVGAVEVSGALALWASPFRAKVAGALALFMLGAIATHLRFQEWPMLVVATAICLSCAWLMRAETKARTGRAAVSALR